MDNRSILDMFGGDYKQTSRVAMQIHSYQLHASLWRAWMIFSIVSLFAAIWLVFGKLLNWGAVPVAFGLLFIGIMSRPRVPDFGGSNGHPSDNA